MYASLMLSTDLMMRILKGGVVARHDWFVLTGKLRTITDNR